MSDQEQTELESTSASPTLLDPLEAEQHFGAETDEDKKRVQEANEEAAPKEEPEEDEVEEEEIPEAAKSEVPEWAAALQREVANSQRQQAAVQSLLARLENQKPTVTQSEPTSLLSQLPEDQRTATNQLVQEIIRNELGDTIAQLKEGEAQRASAQKDLDNETFVRKSFGDDMEKFSPALNEIIAELQDKVTNDPGPAGQQAAETIRLYDMYPQALVSDTRARALEKALAKSAGAVAKQSQKNFKQTTATTGKGVPPEGDLKTRFLAGKASMAEVESAIRARLG